jgi:hypothetical protein
MNQNYVLILSAAATLAACSGLGQAPVSATGGIVSVPVVSEDVRTSVSPGLEMGQPFDNISERPDKGTTVLLVGSGRVLSISILEADDHGVMRGPLMRIGVRMSDGRSQFLRGHALGLTVGDQVQVTREEELRYSSAKKGV